MQNVNSVCFVATINEIIPIPGADNIEQVMVNGWSCVTKKGEYKVSDLVIVATTDAVIPAALSDKMNVTSYLRSGTRVRTVKLRGVYSECLLIPLRYVSSTSIAMEGMDMMDIMGIYKYEPPAKQVQLDSGKTVTYVENINFNKYYKFPNIKNVKGMFTEDDVVEITRKIHGTNARYGIVKKNKITLWGRIKRFLRITDEWHEYEFIIGSHNTERGSTTTGLHQNNVWYDIAMKYDIEARMKEYIRWYGFTPQDIQSGFIVYGEIYGAGIQKNYDYGLKDVQFAMFDVSINGKYLGCLDSNYISTKMDMPYVPILYYGKWSQSIQDSFTKNFIEGTKIPHEGIVIKEKSGSRQKVAKVINPDYLIASEKMDFGDSH